LVSSYKLSYRDLKEMAAERGLEVDHTTIYPWVITFTPELEKPMRLHKRPAGKSWRLDFSLRVCKRNKAVFRAGCSF